MDATITNRIANIQGLRGLAVTLVVLYHAGFLFNGGFIGVDVFFVISGFVIGKSLSREIERSGRVSWANFFFRRARRLVPALSLTLITTIFFYWILLGANSVKTLAKSLTSGSLFLSNFYFFFERGYVDLASDPLRNLWSLSVEEQFYFAMPLLFVFAGFKTASQKQFRRRLFILASGTLFVSFVANLVLVNYSLLFSVPQFLLPGRFAFFSPFTRAWEFLVGLLVAFYSSKSAFSGLFKFASATSLVVIIFIAWWLDSWQPFPGWFALPVVAASAILLFDSDKQLWMSKLLSRQPLVYLGDISYSLYLLHWPLLVIFKQKFGSEDRYVVVALLLSLIFAATSYRLIENPFRLMSWPNRRSFALVATLLVLGPILFVQGAVLFDRGQDSPQAVALNELTVAEIQGAQISLGSKVCLDVHKQVLPKNTSQCVEGSNGSLPIVFLLGDSHSYSISEGVIASAKRNGFRVMTWSRSGCPFLVTSSVNRLCNGNRDYLLDEIKLEKPQAIFIVNGINHYFEGVRDESFVPRGSKARIKSVAASYGETFDFLLRNGVPTVLMYEVPNMDRAERNLGDFLLRGAIIESIDARLAIVENKFGANVSRIDPADMLCREGVCRSTDEFGRSLYADGQHINADGALLISILFDKVFAELKN